MALAAAAPSAMAQQAPAPSEGATAAQIAARLQVLVGTRYDSGLLVKSVTAEQNMVVILIDGPAGFRAGETPASLSASLVEGLCGSAPAFFASGITLRVDTAETGAQLVKGPVVSQCPAGSS